jgi:hypothetical protein
MTRGTRRDGFGMETFFLVNLQLTVIMIKRKRDRPPFFQKGIREGYTAT